MFENLYSETTLFGIATDAKRICLKAVEHGIDVNKVEFNPGMGKPIQMLEEFASIGDTWLMDEFMNGLSRIGLSPSTRPELSALYVYQHAAPVFFIDAARSETEGRMMEMLTRNHQAYHYHLATAAASAEYGVGFQGVVSGLSSNESLTREEFARNQRERFVLSNLTDQPLPEHKLDQLVAESTARLMRMRQLLDHDPTGLEALRYIAAEFRDGSNDGYGRHFHDGVEGGIKYYQAVLPLTAGIVPEHTPRS